MDPDEILLDTEATMEKGFDYMQHEFSAVRTGKASPALVENIDVEAYGSSMKLKQLALITTPEPRSAYLLRGPVRRNWEHSIPPVEHLRYSVTFRNFVEGDTHNQSHRS